MAKYYLIEEYKEYEDRPCGSSWNAYDVKAYNTIDQLEKAILQGAQHGGKLIPARGLEFKLQIIENQRLREG